MAASRSEIVHPDPSRGAMVQTVRDVLAAHGFRESTSATTEGFYFVFEGGDEIAVAYHELEPERSARSAPALGRTTRVLRCCNELAQRGYALALFVSPRTLELRVRAE